MAPVPKGEPPVVTGISPKEGIPGTQITIRGENLGLGQSDLAGKERKRTFDLGRKRVLKIYSLYQILGLTICGVDCILSARWESSRKIIARVGQPKSGLGDVIVTTRTGGRGTSTVQFRVYNVQVGEKFCQNFNEASNHI